MTAEFIVHVGFSKTGTTTLQKHLFTKHSQIKYLGKPYSDQQLIDYLRQLIQVDSIQYDPLPFKEYVKGKVINSNKEIGKVILLSDETLVSYSKVGDKGIVAQRIKEVLTPDKILITIRNQFEILKSAYLSRGRLLINVPPKLLGMGVTFQDWLRLAENRLPRGYIAHVDYYKTIDFYVKLFGRENVCVLLLEEFINQKDTYLKKIAGFLGIDYQESKNLVGEAHEHREITQSQLDFELLRSRIYPFHKLFPVSAILKFYLLLKKKLFPARNDEAELVFPPEQSEFLHEYYRSGNRKLIELCKLPLDKYDYPL